jgi:type IV pilus assembly protein PilP
MSRSLLLAVSALLAVSTVVIGCKKETPSPEPPPAAPKKVAPPAPTQAPQPAAAEKSADAGPAKYVYDPAGRRDPFEPLTAVKGPLPGPEAALTPLQKYDVSQFRLIGVIVGKGEPTAMVTAPDNKSYLLKRGVKIGRNDGTVTKVTSDAVVVLETYVDFTGEVKKGEQVIQLPKREGVR